MVVALPFSLWGHEHFGEFWPNAYLQFPTSFLFLLMFGASLLCLLAGIGILKGQDWARILALAYCVIATLLVAVTYRGHPLYWFNLIGDMAFTVIMWFFLYRPHVSAFFEVGCAP